jgi:predicted  nucleic acid-binding Zn-ribbon protein
MPGIEELFRSFSANTDRDQILIRMLKELTAVSGGVAPPGGLATEVTLQGVLTVLTDLFSEQRIDFELKCIEDANGDIFLLRVRWDENAPGGYTIDYIDAAGNVATPVAPLKLCSPNELLAEIRNLLTSLDGKDFATQTTLSELNDKFNTLGQKASDDSHPVVLSTEQEALIQTIITELQSQTAILQDIDDNTDGLEALATSAIAELQAINLNTDGLEALITAGNVDLAALLAETQGQTTQLNTIISSLTSILVAIQTADTNNQAGHALTQTELVTIQGQLTTAIAALNAIDGNTAPLEASLTAIETAINTQSALQIAELQTIVTNTQNTVTELQTANATLLLINGQFSGTPTTVRVDISGNGAYVVPAGTYFSMQLYVKSGSVSDGVIPHDIGLFVETAPIKGATIPTVTLNATGAVAYVKLMTN